VEEDIFCALILSRVLVVYEFVDLSSFLETDLRTSEAAFFSRECEEDSRISSHLGVGSGRESADGLLIVAVTLSRLGPLLDIIFFDVGDNVQVYPAIVSQL